MKFKIGQLVLMDTVLGVVRAARIESVNASARRARLMMIDTGERLTDVAFGNIALPGEDAERIGRERNAIAWSASFGNEDHAGDYTNRMGGYVRGPAPNPDEL